MVMERMRGVPISQVERLRDAGVTFPNWRAMASPSSSPRCFVMVFPCRHAPGQHPGQPRRHDVRALHSLDFGIVGTLTGSTRNTWRRTSAFFRRDYKRVAELHIESGWVPPPTRVNELETASARSASRISTGR